MKLVESKIYGQLIVIADYLLLGLLWIITSLPLITVGPASVATMYVLKTWRGESTGKILFYFYQGLKKHFVANILWSGVTIGIFFTTNLLLQENNRLLVISGCIISIIYLMFMISWGDNCSQNEKLSFFALFEKSAVDLFLSFGENLLCGILIFVFTILVSLFPPFIFIFAGAVWKLIDLVLSRKSRINK